MAKSEEYSIQLRPMTAACSIISRFSDTKKESKEVQRQSSPKDRTKHYETIATKMSSLTLGSGKITQTGHMDELELHFDNKDFSSLITQRLRPSDRFSVIRENTDCNTTHTKLPKTYVTRSGSLVLYSDSKVMKDKTKSRQSESGTKTFCMKGLRMVPSQEYPRTTWKKYITNSPRQIRTTDMTCMCSADHDNNSRSNGKCLVSASLIRRKTKPIDKEGCDATNTLAREDNHMLSMETVQELSNALLAYRLKQITDRERYENTVINTSDGTQCNTYKEKISALSMDWLYASRRRSQDQDQPTDEFSGTEKHFMLLQRAKTDLSLVSKGRVPTNTPNSIKEKK